MKTWLHRKWLTFCMCWHQVLCWLDARGGSDGSD